MYKLACFIKTIICIQQPSLHHLVVIYLYLYFLKPFIGRNSEGNCTLGHFLYKDIETEFSLFVCFINSNNNSFVKA